MDFISNNINELAKNNYKYIEIIIGTQSSDNIFDTRLEQYTFKAILKFFKNKLNNFKQIQSKNYYKRNLRLNIKRIYYASTYPTTKP